MSFASSTLDRFGPVGPVIQVIFCQSEAGDLGNLPPIALSDVTGYWRLVEGVPFISGALCLREVLTIQQAIR